MNSVIKIIASYLKEDDLYETEERKNNYRLSNTTNVGIKYVFNVPAKT